MLVKDLARATVLKIQCITTKKTLHSICQNNYGEKPKIFKNDLLQISITIFKGFLNACGKFASPFCLCKLEI